MAGDVHDWHPWDFTDPSLQVSVHRGHNIALVLLETKDRECAQHDALLSPPHQHDAKLRDCSGTFQHHVLPDD